MEPDAVELRVLGCLIEKQRTTPDAYPLSLNALRLACNQSTNRDPVVDYDEADARQKITFAGGIAGTEGIVHTGLGPLSVQRGSTFKYGRIAYTHGQLRLQGFVNALDGEAPPLLQRSLDGGPVTFRFENQAYDMEFWFCRYLPKPPDSRSISTV